MSIEHILDGIIRREGGYVNNPADRGGPTNWGITLKTLSDWRKKECTEEDVKALTQMEAKNIYREVYVTPFMSYTYDTPTLELIVDSAVNHGVARVMGWLEGLKSSDPNQIYKHVFKERMMFYGRIIARNKSQAIFASGWMNRLAEFVR